MKKNDFNRAWTVVKEGENEGYTVNLPHDAMIYEKRSKDAAGTGACGYFEEGKYTYTHTFAAPAEWAEKTLILECEAVYKNSSVLLNGELLYAHPYGYTNYFVNLTGKVKAGEENTITIVADNSKAPTADGIPAAVSTVRYSFTPAPGSRSLRKASGLSLPAIRQR